MREHANKLILILRGHPALIWRNVEKYPSLVAAPIVVKVAGCGTPENSEAATVVTTDNTPLIFVPGITGSYLEHDLSVNPWPHGSNENQLRFTLGPSEGSNAANVRVTDVLLTPSFCFIEQDIYKPCSIRSKRTVISARDGKSSNPTLFIFAYDWQRASGVLKH
jgi:hypothetical protein